ncbi:MAG: 50S ribosomal protein L34 [Planctomycetota bacterium]|nr:MAG: 50S ribosomal protein L34 [Planctomycetota bacterium]
MRLKYRKSNLKRARKMGFRARMRTRGGRAIIRRQRKRRGVLNK